MRVQFKCCFFILVSICLAWSQFQDGLEEDMYGNPYGDPYGDPYSSDPYASADVVTTIESISDLQSFIEGNVEEPVILGLFNSESAEGDKSIFEEVADKDGRAYRFALSSNEDVLKEMKVTKSAVYVYKPAKFVSEKYESRRSRCPYLAPFETLRRCIHEKSLPLVGERTFQSMERYDNIKGPILTVFADIDHSRDEKGFQYLLTRLRKVAVDYEKQFTFNIANKKDFSPLLKDYDLDLSKYRSIGVGIKNGITYYHMDEELPFSVDNVKSFIVDYVTGKLLGKVLDINAQPKSNQGDAEWDSSVVQLSATNFQQVVKEGNADVMIDFYAPWCGHCKHLKPEYNIVAKNFASDETVVIAAFDATASNVPSGFDVQGYPTLYFVPKGSKKPISYDGDRSASAITAFIQKHKTKTA